MRPFFWTKAAVNALNCRPRARRPASAKAALLLLSEDPNEPFLPYAVDRGVRRGALAVLRGVRQDAAAGRAAPRRTNPPSPTASPSSTATPITRTEYDLYVKSLLQGKQQELTPEQKNQVLDEMISMQLMAEQAEKDGLDKDPDTRPARGAAHARARRCGIAEVLEGHGADGCGAARRIRHRHRRDGQDRISRAAHPGRRPRKQAEQIIKKIKGGAKFEDLAKASRSTARRRTAAISAGSRCAHGQAVRRCGEGPEEGRDDPGAGADAVRLARDQLEDTRAGHAPPFDQVKAQLTNSVMRKKLQAYVDDLKKNAKIEKKLDTGAAPAAAGGAADGAPAPAAPAAPAAAPKAP